MKVICAWCGAMIREGDGHAVSHGLCPKCRHNPEVLQGKSLEDFANGFPFPVVILNTSLRPLIINLPAYRTLTHHQQISCDATMGAIVECTHSKEPGGCGQTIHCTGCVLRNTMTKTNATGEAFTDVPAKLTTDSDEVIYYISTMKVDGHVMVKMVRAEN